MSSSVILRSATIVNEGKQQIADVYIKDGIIQKIGANLSAVENTKEYNLEGKYLLPGCIDDQVHFREPGLTHKANIGTESRAAVAGDGAFQRTRCAVQAAGPCGQCDWCWL